MLLEAMGKLDEARPLLEEALQARRETLGDRHPDTLRSVGNTGDLLEHQGMLSAAIPFFTEELEGLVLLHGMEFQETRESAEHLAELLCKSGGMRRPRHWPQSTSCGDVFPRELQAPT